jgi:hypothetical protein
LELNEWKENMKMKREEEQEVKEKKGEKLYLRWQYATCHAIHILKDTIQCKNRNRAVYREKYGNGRHSIYLYN